MTKKALCMLLCACLAAGLLTGCNPFRKDGRDSDGTSEPPEIVYGSDPSSEPEKPAMTEEEAQSAFAELDRAMAAWYAGTDGFLFRTAGDIPDGMKASEIPYTFENLTVAARRMNGMQAADYLERLDQIPRSLLTEAQQTDYDIISEVLGQISSLAVYDYRSDPLSLYDGALTGLYLQFLSMEVQSAQQAEEYLVLLSAYASYLDSVLAYEQARAAQGMFMTEHALDIVLNLLSSLTRAGTGSGLSTVFAGQIQSAGSVPDAQKQAYIARCDALMTGRVIPAMERLSAGLSALRASCRKEGGIGKAGSDGKEYYALRLQQETGTLFTADEFLDRVEDLLWVERVRLMELEESGETAGAGTADGSAYTYRTGTAELMRITQLLLPGASMHDVSARRMPAEIVLPADTETVLACMMPPYAQDQPVLPGSCSDGESFLALSETVYPVRQFAASSDGAGWMRSTLRIPGFRALSGMLSEEISLQKQILFPERSLQEARLLRRIAALTCASVSVRVNCYDYSRDQIRLFTDSLQLDFLDGLGDIFYQLAVDEPFCSLSTAAGICLSGDLLDRDLNGDSELLFRTVSEIGSSTFGPLLERILIRLVRTEG